MFTQVIDYETVEVTLPPPVKKQVWDGQQFVPMTLYRHIGFLKQEQQDWMYESFGPPGVYINGQYWNTTRAGGYTVMDERVYTWFALKWIKK